MQLIDGKATANAIKEQIAEEVAQIVANGGKQPHLAAVLVGHDGGSETYVKNKVLACEKCGFKSTLIRYEDDVTEEELLACVDKLNKEFNAGLSSPEAKKKIAEMGLTVVASTPAQATQLVNSEIQRWSAVIKQAGIKPD